MFLKIMYVFLYARNVKSEMQIKLSLVGDRVLLCQEVIIFIYCLTVCLPEILK